MPTVNRKLTPTLTATALPQPPAKYRVMVAVAATPQFPFYDQVKATMAEHNVALDIGQSYKFWVSVLAADNTVLSSFEKTKTVVQLAGDPVYDIPTDFELTN